MMIRLKEESEYLCGIASSRVFMNPSSVNKFICGSLTTCPLSKLDFQESKLRTSKYIE